LWDGRIGIMEEESGVFKPAVTPEIEGEVLARGPLERQG
jgi:hypothetical protein